MRLAHKLALESDRVRADCIEAMEFPHLVVRYEVRGVPRTVINDSAYADGALPEQAFVRVLEEALGRSESA